MIFSLVVRKKVKGFTLIEVMVAMFIMSVSTLLLLANYPDSTVRLQLLNNTHSTALLVREAQIRGSAIDSEDSTVGGYGIFINKASSEVILFTDSIEGVSYVNNAGMPIGDGLYDTGASSDTIKKTLLFDTVFTFTKLCVASSTASENSLTPKPFLCDTVNSQSIGSLTVSFNRPSQVAHIYVNGRREDDFSSACIQMYSLKTPTPGHVRSLRVLHSGVITTTATACE